MAYFCDKYESISSDKENFGDLILTNTNLVNSKNETDHLKCDSEPRNCSENMKNESDYSDFAVKEFNKNRRIIIKNVPPVTYNVSIR